MINNLGGRHPALDRITRVTPILRALLVPAWAFVMCALEPAVSDTDTASSRSTFWDTWSRVLLGSRITEFPPGA